MTEIKKGKLEINSEIVESGILNILNKIGYSLRKDNNKENYSTKQGLEDLKLLEEIKEKLESYENKEKKENVSLRFEKFIPKFGMLHYSFNKSLYKVIPSPRGLGKTYNSAKIWLKYLIEEHDNDMTWFRYHEKNTHEFVKTFSNIIDKENLRKYCYITENSKSGFTEIRSKVTNSILDFRGVHSVYQNKGIEGKNKLLFDEATQFPLKSILQLIGSVRNKPKEEHWFLFNLGTDKKYINMVPNYFIDQMEKNNAFILELTQSDNIYINEEYHAKLEGFKHLDEESYFEATGKKVEKVAKKDKKKSFSGIVAREKPISPKIRNLFSNIF